MSNFRAPCAKHISCENFQKSFFPFFRLLQLKFRIQRESRDKCACPAIRDFDVLVQDLVITLTQNSTDATCFLFCTYMIYNQSQRFNVSKRLRFHDEDSTLLLAFNLIILDLWLSNELSYLKLEYSTRDWKLKPLTRLEVIYKSGQLVSYIRRVQD